MNGYQILACKLIVHARTLFLIPIFRRLYGTAAASVQLSYLEKLPVGTLGRGVADILHDNHLQLIPPYENHDLKHVLLAAGAQRIRVLWRWPGPYPGPTGLRGLLRTATIGAIIGIAILMVPLFALAILFVSQLP